MCIGSVGIGMFPSRNVLGQPLDDCSCDPMTGWYRDGKCNTDDRDFGSHTVCCVVTESFLEFALRQGNDLITPAPQHGFPGLKPGDSWCVCALRWKEAYENGCAPKIYLRRTNKKVLKLVDLEILKEFALDLE